MERILLKVSEVSEILSIGKSKAYQMVQQGQIPSVRIGTSKLLRVPAEGLRKWAADLQNAQESSKNA